MKVFSLLFIILISLFCSPQIFSQENSFEGWECKEFSFQGHDAKIVFPKKSNDGKYWVWRARFWGHEPQLDKALLEVGFHVVYVDVAGFFGNNEAVALWNDFYKFLRKEYDLNRKVVLEGMSRGGLIVYNWASQNTKKVACIYADAPVCDIKSWPGGLYRGIGSESDWEACLRVYNLDEKSVFDFEGIPINNAVKIAKANIPAIHVCGLADKVVPYAENTEKLAKNFKDAGGKIELILKEGVGHHPHSLEDPRPLVDFVLKNTINKK
ncbi:alpha/beta hydrolase family protein [Maribellus maritimus]|uniref:alpha/beta hydrolase family protein n=1 Tax=Maribellus maritimus TaxID=2870838 RepID=UPI001EEC3E31|nr:alpha/beta hydrolase [Maribellus maritimus]MCG6185932.1 alpha/beta hydrolase [Maribellus maritimus]